MASNYTLIVLLMVKFKTKVSTYWIKKYRKWIRSTISNRISWIRWCQQFMDCKSSFWKCLWKRVKQPNKKKKINLFIICREPVPCGSTIRLKHANTKGYLHSHLHSSPLSRQQEVSCFDGNDDGDDWKVECSGTHWLREEPVQLVHKQTSTYLTGSESHTFGQPIPGQIEIATYKSASKHSRWVAQVRKYTFFFFSEGGGEEENILTYSLLLLLLLFRKVFISLLNKHSLYFISKVICISTTCFYF